MASDQKFKLLRRLLRAIGLSEKSADEVVNTIVNMLAGEGKNDKKGVDEFPYFLNKNFITPAELNFLSILRQTVSNQIVICTKVSLGDLFTTKRDDYSQYTTYMNKIKRKHVDFLLCDSATMRPLVGIELDDKSHEREDRKERDKFVDGVFKASGLPLLHIPVKRSYVPTELTTQLAPYLNIAIATPTSSIEPKPISTQQTPKVAESPKCPKCGSEMVLRTAKSGANAGNQFWGCTNFPTCRAMLPIKD
jgi:predicted RNA-binding Zn-ribbon protein involved in translation (DUF1610 family)